MSEPAPEPEPENHTADDGRSDFMREPETILRSGADTYAEKNADETWKTSDGLLYHMESNYEDVLLNDPSTVPSDPDVICPGCDDNYDYIGVHWSRSPECGHPELPEAVKEAFTGLLMGDAWISEPSGTNNICNLDVQMTNKPFLDWLSNALVPFVTDNRLEKTGAEVAKSARGAGMNAVDSNTHDQYKVRARSHPYFDALRRWYETGNKVFPEDLELTPIITKMWYVCDGGVRWVEPEFGDEIYGNVFFAATNEMENFGWLCQLFRDIGVDPHVMGHKIFFNVPNSRKLLDWMGAPLPGFEYKWEMESHDEHYDLKTEVYNYE